MNMWVFIFKLHYAHGGRELKKLRMMEKFRRLKMAAYASFEPIFLICFAFFVCAGNAKLFKPA